MVEDNPGDVQLIQKALDQTNFIENVDVATDGAQALDYLTKKNDFSGKPTPDIVLLDLNLPKQHGLEVLKTIRQDDELKDVAVMVLTSSDSPKEMDVAYTLSAKVFMPKPGDKEEIATFAHAIQDYWDRYMDS